jgi:hypothetical protein
MIGIGWATLYNAIIESYQKKLNVKTESQTQPQVHPPYSITNN